MPRALLLRHTPPRLATLSLLWGDGPIRPVNLAMCLLQKHRLAIVQPSVGRLGPLMTETVPPPLLNLIMLHCLGLLMQQLNIAVLRLIAVVPCSASFKLPLQKTPLLSISVYGLLLTNLLLRTNVRVRLLGEGRIPQEKSMLHRELLFNKCLKPGRLPGAETTRTLWTFVTTSMSNGQQTTGPLHMGSSRPEAIAARGHSSAFEFLVRTTFPTKNSSLIIPHLPPAHKYT